MARQFRLRYGRRFSVILLLLVMFTISSPLARSYSSNYGAFQIGARGDNSSIGNLGVSAEIRTNAYHIDNPNATPRQDSFWIGSVLANGAFIQFGYTLLVGNYCLRGYSSNGTETCQGIYDNIENGDARLFWAYFPAASSGWTFYYWWGSSMSAGANGTWHTYSMVSSTNGWNFVLDGQTVSDLLNVSTSVSKEAPTIVAEQGTTTSPGRLGPAEFRNLRYLKSNGWQSVGGLYAQSSCGVGSACAHSNPYGVSVVGPNDIVAGSGMQPVSNSQLLWSSVVFASTVTNSQPTTSAASNSTTSESQPSSGGGSIVILGVILLIVVGVVFVMRRRGRVQPSPAMHLPETRPSPPSTTQTEPLAGGFCMECGAQIKLGKRFCTKCGAPVTSTTQTSDQPTAPTCPNCGSRVPVGKKFCTSCGTRLVAT